MKKSNNNSQSYLKPNSNWWSISLIFLLIITLGIINSSCGKDCDNDEYYVKYEVNSSTIYGGKLDVTINSEDNTNSTFTINQCMLWETIIGPVSKGFNATLKVSAIGETHDKLKLYTNIYVSKNDSPFALKNSDGSELPRDSVEINYTIDY
jgi:hypothetical protein